MTVAELLAAAAPACRECGLPVVRAEATWRHEAGVWCQDMTLVCEDGHRVSVEPFA